MISVLLSSLFFKSFKVLGNLGMSNSTSDQPYPSLVYIAKKHLQRGVLKMEASSVSEENSLRAAGT